MTALAALLTAGIALGGAAGATTPTSVAAAAAHNPAGTFNVGVQGRYVHVYGNIKDPDQSGPLTVAYRLNGVTHRVGTTMPQAGGLYSTAWTLPYGTWNVQVLAVNVGIGTTNPVIGSRTVSLIDPATRNPRGAVAVAQSGSLVRVWGWTYDPDAPWFGLPVAVYDNGRHVSSTVASGRSHVWVSDLRLAPGRHFIYAVAANVGRGTRNPIIGTRWVTVNPPPAPAWQSAYAGSQRIAASMLAAYGWDGSQMAPLIALWNRESGWNPHAANPSGAYGIPQALPGSKMASAGGDWANDPATQIRWGLGYIKGVYGSPAAAWAHSQATGWY